MLYSYKIIISYDGTDYSGWQWQKNVVSIYSIVRSTFARICKLKEEDFLFVGASRTDAGVHAHGQVARLRTNLKLHSERIQRAWNDALPGAIQIMHVELVDEVFHPQHGIAHKVYTYRFFTQRPSVRGHRFGYYIHKKVDFVRLREALNLFVGTHDFAAFCKEPSEDRSTVLTVDSILLEKCESTDAHVIVVTGKSFLRHMIRRIVGASLWVSMYPDISLTAIQDGLKNKKLNQTLPTAPAQGLCLERIKYT